MVHASDIDAASFEVRRKAKQTRAFERGPCVLVVPKDENKAMRYVTFLPHGGVTCVDAVLGDPCEANSRQLICYHSFSAKRRREINKKLRATIRAKKQGFKAA